MSAWRRLAVLLPAILALVAALSMPVPARASGDWTGALMQAATRLWAPLPDGARIAVAPLDPDVSGLPDPLLRDVERSLTAALLATAPPDGRVAERRDLGAVWEEVGSFGQRTAESLLAEAAVDALVVASVVERGEGVALSGVLLDLRPGSAGEVLATLGPVALAVDVSAVDLADTEAGARRLGVALAEGLRAATDPTSAFAVRVTLAGDQGAPVGGSATEWLGALVSEHLVRRLALAPRYVSRPLRRLGELAPRRSIRLDLSLWDRGERADLLARAEMDGAVFRASVRIATASLPAAFRPLTRDGGRVGRGLSTAVGQFDPAGPTDRRETLFAARALARAALVDARLRSGESDRRGRGFADLSAAMTRLADAVPHEEIWRDLPTTGGGAVQELKARVAPVGGGRAPAVEAAVERAVYRAGEPLAVRVLVRGGRAHLAAFAWQADDTVVRIAPAEAAARRVEAGVRAALPGPGDPEIATAPMAGSRETVEAVIVVASAVPFDADALAPFAGASAARSLAGAVEMSGFLDALVGLDLARISLAVLPYRVRPAD